MKKVYLACPFANPDPDIRAHRVYMADQKAADLMMQGYLVFSPLSHSFPISKHCSVDPCDNDFWLRQDLWVLAICDEMHILCLEGWEKSKGIKTEIEFAEKLGIVVRYIDGV